MIRSVFVFSLHSQQRQQLANSRSGPTIVPSSHLVLEIEGADLPNEARLDSVAIPIALNGDATRGYGGLDASRSVGFHRLEVAGRVFLFGTEDAKLRLDGVREMLSYIDTTGLSWGQQLFFADGKALRHAKVDYAWLTANWGELSDVSRRIAERPIRRSAVRSRRTREVQRRLRLSDTLQLLRSNVARHLESHPSGVFEFQGQRFHPNIGVVVVPHPTGDTRAHRRLTRLLESCEEVGAGLLADLPPSQRRGVRAIIQEARQLLNLYPFSALRDRMQEPAALASPEEQVDDRYRVAFRLAEEFRESLGWEAGSPAAGALFAFVTYADEVYQAFVAVVLADAFKLQLAVPALEPKLQLPCFRSERYELYYDTVPPAQWFRNWRAQSIRPAEMRPDLTLIDLEQRAALLLDAKYRIRNSGSLPPSSASDCQVYMQAFGVPQFAVCYPGDKLREISGDGNRILEVPIRPGPGLAAYAQDVLKPALEGLMLPVTPTA